MATLTDAQTVSTRSSKFVRFFKDQRRWTPYVFVAPFFITFAVFTLYPMLRPLSWPFKSRSVSPINGSGLACLIFKKP